MLHILLAIKRTRFSNLCFSVLWLGASAGALILASGRPTTQGSQGISILDLTAEVSPNEQGYYHGIPGSSGGGATGGWRPGPGDTVRYQLPLSLEVLDATLNKDSNFVFELLLRNTGDARFDLPSSPKLTTIEKPGNKSRRVFFLQLQPLTGSRPGIVPLGFAAIAGSTSIPGSFIRLDPGKSLKILLLASSDLIRRSFPPRIANIDSESHM